LVVFQVKEIILFKSIKNYWTPVWTLSLSFWIIEPLYNLALSVNYPQVKVGDNYSIVEKEGVSYFFVDIYGV